jgi:heme O synthase-like polyprenyltransferase
VNPQDQQVEHLGAGASAASRFLRLIRFSHTIFALPFALGSFVVAANGRPSPRTFLLILVCMVCARTAAMLFNRLIDWSLDQRNPRTASRHLLLSKSAVAILLGISSAGFIAGAAAINRLTFLLSPVARFFSIRSPSDSQPRRTSSSASRSPSPRSARGLRKQNISILRQSFWARESFAGSRASI